MVLLFSFYVGVLLHAIRADPNLAPLGHDLLMPPRAAFGIQYLPSVALVGAFTLSLRVLHAPIGWRYALTGGCTGAALWDRAAHLPLYLANSKRSSRRLQLASARSSP
jgi:hypothetical protein